VILEGVVDSFDGRRGDGFVLSDDGERLYFHCVALRDGTREIEPGTRVRGRRRVGHLGRDEIIEIDKL
jgi:cold shock CspA family protein